MSTLATSPILHCGLLSDANIYRCKKTVLDTRTPQRWQRRSFPSPPDAPSLQSLCVCVCEAPSWCLCKHFAPSREKKKNLFASTASRIQGGGRGWAEEKNASTRPTRRSDRGWRCASAAGATPGFYLQRLKQQTAASGNPLAQVCDVPYHVPSFTAPHSPHLQCRQ